MKKIYVLDTSVYLTDANSIASFGTNDVVIPLKVLEEIDKHKKRQDSVGSNARKIIRKLDNLSERREVSLKESEWTREKGLSRLSDLNASIYQAILIPQYQIMK